MQHLDYVYVDSIKVCENKNETMRKRIINILTNNTDAHEEGAALYVEEIAWLKNYWKPSEEQMTNLINVRNYVAQASGHWCESLSSLIDDLQKL